MLAPRSPHPAVTEPHSATNGHPNKDHPNNDHGRDDRSKSSNGSNNNNNNKPEYRLAVALAVFGMGAFSIDTLFNRAPSRIHESPDTLYSSPQLKEYLLETFKYVASALALTTATAFIVTKNLHRILPNLHKPNYKFTYIFHPLFLITSLTAVYLTTNVTLKTPVENTNKKHAFLAASALAKGLLISSTLVLAPALFTRGLVYMGGIVGCVSWVAATSRSDHYIYTGAPLLCGLAVSMLTVSMPVIAPAGAVLTWYQAGMLYAGVTVFGGALLWDVGKVLKNAQKVADGKLERDVVNEAVRVYLDIVNLMP
ncbi:inhibitor of apoptosis-promoting Bax1-domain-containing protein [Chytriomyces cf. hyalinus JEL632]|nr:inhibitor of apoptosis-promoting Bax1-domain-containing protein [Chytriomyces cf. hyalinus JEL632]